MRELAALRLALKRNLRNWIPLAIFITSFALLVAGVGNGNGAMAADEPVGRPIVAAAGTRTESDILIIVDELSSGDVQAQTIFGTDDREPVTDTEASPWRTIAQLVGVHGISGFTTCTGTFVTANVVLTAAHCLYNYEDGSAWLTDALVIPGATAQISPFGSALASWFVVPDGWVNTGSFAFPRHSPGRPFLELERLDDAPRALRRHW